MTRKGEGWERGMRERQISALKPKQASVNVLVPLRMQMNTLALPVIVKDSTGNQVSILAPLYKQLETLTCL